MSDKATVSVAFKQFKDKQREMWSNFAVNEWFTTLAASELVSFARVRAGEHVLDVGCGTGVVAITAARQGAAAKGLDLTPELLERARENATIAGLPIEFIEGDAEAMPYADASFDVVISQFGHMFAPRPEVVVAEMLRVLRPGGRIAFSTWPPEHFMGKNFVLMARYMPPPPAGAPIPAPPPQWGDPNVVRARLGDAVADLRFGRGTLSMPALSAKHVLVTAERTFGPLQRLLANLDKQNPERAAALRAEVIALASENMEGNAIRQHYLMSMGTKRA